jgi:carboxyl-terminal processing protease
MGIAEALDLPIGLWRSRGYGWVLDVGGDGAFNVRDVTALSNVLVDGGPAGSFFDAFERAADDSGLSLRHRGDVTAYRFDRIEAIALPSAIQSDRDQLRNFDVLARCFEEHYAFFALRGVDWREACAVARERVRREGSEESLWAAALDLIGPLKDAHVGLSGDGRATDVTSPIRERKAVMQRALGVPPWSSDRRAYSDGLSRALGEMFLSGPIGTTANNMMIYGETAPGIGYIALLGEFGHASTQRSCDAMDLPRPRLEAASFLADEIKGIRQGLDEVCAALATMRAIIVDVRFNYGGYDRLSLEFASRFVDRSSLAFRKRTWADGTFVNVQDIMFEQGSPSLSHAPVYLLTGRQTASAGEILVLAMMSRDRLTRIGEPTLGILSDNLYKRMPNGWEISLSNEVYETADGVCWEGAGIPPDRACTVFDPADPLAGMRTAVAIAVDAAQGEAAL